MSNQVIHTKVVSEFKMVLSEADIEELIRKAYPEVFAKFPQAVVEVYGSEYNGDTEVHVRYTSTEYTETPIN